MAGNGAFYTLPNANDVCFGHLCDLIYVDDERSKNDRAEWDKASTSEKLGVCAVCMYGAGQLHLEGDESVLDLKFTNKRSLNDVATELPCDRQQ